MKGDTNLGQAMLLGTPGTPLSFSLARSRGVVPPLWLSAKRTVTRTAALRTRVKVVGGSRRRRTAARRKEALPKYNALTLVEGAHAARRYTAEWKPADACARCSAAF